MIRHFARYRKKVLGVYRAPCYDTKLAFARVLAADAASDDHLTQQLIILSSVHYMRKRNQLMQMLINMSSYFVPTSS